MGNESAPGHILEKMEALIAFLSEGGSLYGGTSLVDLGKQKSKEFPRPGYPPLLCTRGFLMFISPGVIKLFASFRSQNSSFNLSLNVP